MRGRDHRSLRPGGNLVDEPQPAKPFETPLQPPRRKIAKTLDFDCPVQEVKYRLTDGTEVPARIVLKDEDLDLAFLAPLKPLTRTQAKIAANPLEAQPATWMCSIRRSLWTGRAKA